MIKGKASQAGWTGSGMEVGRQAKSTGTHGEFDVTGHWVCSHTQSGRRLQRLDNQSTKGLEQGILYNAQLGKDHT